MYRLVPDALANLWIKSTAYILSLSLDLDKVRKYQSDQLQNVKRNREDSM